MEQMTIRLGDTSDPSITPATIGRNRAAIICPLQGPDASSLVASARRIAQTACDVVEWRVDTLASTEEAVLKGALQVVRRELKVPLLATARTSTEGGALPAEELDRVVTVLLEAGVDAIDIEASAETAGDLIDRAFGADTVVVLSAHDFTGTTGVETLLDEFTAMQQRLLDHAASASQTMSEDKREEWAERGWGIVKIATTPVDPMDIYKLMVAGRRFVDTVATVPIIAISMGQLGQLTRTYPGALGSAATFAASPGEESAPGQISVESLSEFHAQTGCLNLNR
ncbi:MAG: type I 3-dehydroquinate dehydratase [Actinomycetaceae bacterium]|nr:type I 3-dehydroquinate dehydratase [Actinomycetaceae bacterium]